MLTSQLPFDQHGHVRSSVVGRIGWVVLDNPRKRNAMSLAMWRSLATTIRDLDQNPAVRCIVIRGEGELAFCAGSDIDQKQGIDASQAGNDTELILESQRAVQDASKPVIAMVSGYCLGGGMGIALGCDMRLASSNAAFGVPAAKLGLSYYYREIKLLTDLVGPARAKQILFSGNKIQADRALLIGLIDEVVPPSELLAYVTNLADNIAANAPLSIAAAKHAINTVTADPTTKDIAACDARARACLSSEDYAEGRRAFSERRSPQFVGR